MRQGTPEPERWWEPRRPDEPVTAEFLGRVLDELGASDLAARARLGHFDDYFAPEEIADGFELIRLVIELRDWSKDPRRNRVTRQRARVVMEHIKLGEFDGTREESARWEASKGGQEAMNDPEAVAFAADVLEKAKDPTAVAEALEAVDRLVGE